MKDLENFIRQMIGKVVLGRDLELAEMEAVMTEIMTGAATPAQIGSFITALRIKGESVPEITGAAKVMRAQATRIDTGLDLAGGELLVDTCGTGGDSSHTFNISTTTALVAAAAGLKVAKHGNRSVSSRCGSADVLAALGVNLELGPEQVAECICQVGIGFLFAPLLHGAMKYAIGPRREIGLRTIFNVLGPLTNPAGANVQLLGVYDPELTTTIAAVLRELGSRRAMVVHGAGGLDELSLAGENRIAWLQDGEIKEITLHPAAAGLKEAANSAVRGGEAEDNAGMIKAILDARETGAGRDIVLLNSAALLVVAGRADDFSSGVGMAADLIDSGAVQRKLAELVDCSQSFSLKS